MVGRLNPSSIADAKVLWNYLSIAPRTDTRVDVAIALGSHDLSVALHAADFMLSGRSNVLVVTGGVGKGTPRGWESEAAEYAAAAIRRGVPSDRIVIEDLSRNTGENITFSRQVLLGRGIVPQNAILITKPYMQRRAYATAQRQWPEVDWYSTAEDISLEHYLERQPDPTVCIDLLVGDTQRIKVYAENGFQVPQNIPSEVTSALNRLVALGYVKHYLRV